MFSLFLKVKLLVDELQRRLQQRGITTPPIGRDRREHFQLEEDDRELLLKVRRLRVSHILHVYILLQLKAPLCRSTQHIHVHSVYNITFFIRIIFSLC